jgi:hypothetical protein
MKDMSGVTCSLRPAQHLGAYVVERLLGCGGSGEVYCVRDTAHDRSVALKLLPRATIETRSELVRPFQREYHRLQLLRHPRIVEVYQYGSEAAGLYYTMELIDGPDLKALVPLPWRQTCLLLRDVALSLAIVHSRRLLHRDVAPGNVRCGRDGRAKLLDFGATVSMGIPCSVVGTPPCTPPEALEQEPLDARADLFGLGALGYFLLTGIHAYPANAFAQLASVWSAPLAVPSALSPGLPNALDHLISSLLQRDRRLRPRSATEVINHLEAIADLQPVPVSEAAQASFVAPALVGRLAELDLLACHVAAARKGQGSVVLIEGAPGQGRTRLLSQLAVEASHGDVLVVAPDARSGAGRGIDAGFLLFDAILRQAPDSSRRALREQEAQLASMLPVAPKPEATTGETARSARQQQRRALCDALLALTKQLTLIVLVDDLQLCDEPSAALLASLAQRAHEHRLLIVASKQSGAPVAAPSAIQTLTQKASRVLLRPLDARAIEELVCSVFVDAPHAKFVADWVAGLSEGNPGKIALLLRHLVEHNLVEFRDGAWVLPEHIDAALLPSDVAEALQGRVRSLSTAARELAELLCVIVRPATPEDLRALSSDAGECQGPLLGALDELIAADVISGDAERYLVSGPALREIFLQGLSAEQLRGAHLRLGRALARHLPNEHYDAKVELPTAFGWSLAGYHLMLGGERERGVRLWANSLRYAFEIDHVPMWDGNMWYLQGNLLALATAEALGMPSGMIASLQVGVVQSAIHGDPRFVVYGERCLVELERAAGLHDYRACVHLSDETARSMTALQLATERWRNTPEAARGLSPIEAIPLLVTATFSLACIYGHTFNTRELAELPAKLAPYAPLSPACRVFQRLIEATLAGATGRTDRELRLRLAGLSGIDSEEMNASVNETARYHLRGFTLYSIATIEAVRDPAQGLRRAAQMEVETPFMSFGIWQVRLLAYVYEGNTAEAQACSERMEIAAVQDGALTKYQLHATGLQYLAVAHALAGDLMSLKAIIDKLHLLAQTLASWQPFCDAARAEYHRLRGQRAEARALAERAVASFVPGQQRGYAFALTSLLRVLLDGGEFEAANRVAVEAIAYAREKELGAELQAQLAALDALALARLGDSAGARAQAELASRIAETAGFAGLLMSDLQHCQAQVALIERDGARFERHAALLARHSCAHQHPVSMARYKRLLADAAASGVVYSVALAGGETLAPHTDLRAMLLGELYRKSFARSLPERVLELMLERTGVSMGFLFSLDEDRLQLIAPLEAEVPAGLASALQECIVAERALARCRSVNTLTATLTSLVRADNGQLFQVAVLNVLHDDGALSAAGALALRVHDEIPAIPRWDCILALSSVLNAPG